ncbi:helix-turn-helix transcriptional regulator [Ancylobacter sonchi]|uniref:helix-turn-helix domain-containing protein n=1 Tax=Ancylobacter sonchi TaxID=1937790 RepID=UPI001BD1FE3A|nr:XRE family transcriptional regulator [Ancylobacter sonchi]MBS7536566.1 helix-turn-helix transcriptional regulator [Ancylobacter sonchi]
MSNLIDDTEARLARRLKLEREARGWSLADLAARAEVGKATISKIERGEISPTAVTLVRLANAFGLTLAGLLLRAEGADRLVRAADQPLWRDPATAYLRRQIFARPDHPVELVEVELPPGARVTLPASSYAPIRQVLQLREGALTLIEDGTRHELKPGDALGFGPPAEVTFANEGAVPCRYIVALTRL